MASSSNITIRCKSKEEKVKIITLTWEKYFFKWKQNFKLKILTFIYKPGNF